MQNDVMKQLKSLKLKSVAMKVAGVVAFIVIFIGFTVLFDKPKSTLVYSSASSNSGSIATVIGFVLGGAVGYLLFRMSKKYTDQAKYLTGNIGQTVLQEVLKDLKYDPQRYFPSQEVHQTNLYPGFEHATGSDYVRGLYRNVPLRFSDLHLTHTETDSDGHTSTVTDFKGTFIAITCDKKINGEVTLKEGKGFPLFKGKRIETENEAFNKQFIITGSSQQDAFYILTPQFMETIVNADQYANAKTRMYFSGNTIYVGLQNNRNLFEAKGAGTMYAVTSSMRSDLKYVTRFVDIILTNPSLFDQTKIAEK